MVIKSDILLYFIINNPSNFTTLLKSEKYKNLYRETYDYINDNFSGNKFSEKCYNFIYGDVSCKLCSNIPKFISFFKGYNRYCSINCKSGDISVIKKIKKTKLLRYGNENYNNITKNKQTCIARYGVTNGAKTEKSKQLTKYTKILKYGSVSYNNQSKTRDTCIIKYGVSSFSKTNEFRKTQSDRLQNKDYQVKLKNGMIRKYGTPHPAHVGEIAEKMYNFKYHEYILPSTKTILLQGNEPILLTNLLKVYNEDEILHKKIDMPKFMYFYNNTIHRYYPDFYIPCENLIIEVKSKYTNSINKEINKKKFKSVIKKGFKFKLYIIN